MKDTITAEFISRICAIYNDSYDDTVEDSSIKGSDWAPGKKSNHKSLRSFQQELSEKYDIHLSTGKIKKILITGGVYSTELSRSVASELEKYGSLPNKERIEKVSELLGITTKTVYAYAPYYERQIYKEGQSANARYLQTRRQKENAAIEEIKERQMDAILDKVKGVLTEAELDRLKGELER